MQESLRTVKYSASDAIKFEKVALKLGRSKRLVFTQMVDYFYRSKKDPTDLNDELLKNTILKGQKEYIGFIKTQEAELLIPIKRDVARMVESQKTIMGCFNSQFKNGSMFNQPLERQMRIILPKFFRYFTAELFAHLRTERR